MNVVVLNGSPKGKYSVTLKSVEFLSKCYDDTFDIIHISQKIRYYKQKNRMQGILEKIEKADIVLFAYPVYTFIAPYQLHEFIQLIKESDNKNVFRDKMVSQISTSKHFYDVTAHKYIEENAYDLGMYVTRGLSADMDDLLTDKGQETLIKYWSFVKYSFDKKCYQTRHLKKDHDVSLQSNYFYRSVTNENEQLEQLRDQLTEKSNVKYDTVIVTDNEAHPNIKEMIKAFDACYPYKVRVVNLSDFKFSGGCLGCYHCASDGVCIYKDGFEDFFKTNIQVADAVIFATEIKDHYFDSIYKCFDDRQFCNGHRTVTMGMPVGYILSGKYSEESNLQVILEGRAEVGHHHFCGVVCDEINDDHLINTHLEALSHRMTFALENQLELPQNFYGVGGMKIFRDLIYLMKGLMKEDHRFYKTHHFYDFPQRQYKRRLQGAMLGMLMSIPGMKEKSKGKMNDFMIQPYDKVIEKKESHKK